ncbi:MAG: putative membrane protein YfcA [Candidatus Azotimanducaceae bacterium]|jgi:uncharacterized membrane protein YfcA
MEQWVFLVLVAIGALVQTIAGFAMGLIIMGGVALFGLVDISVAAAVVSFIGLLNAAIALRRTYQFVDRALLQPIALGMAPLIIVGVLLLGYWSDTNHGLLKTALGVMIVFAGIMLMLKPNPYADRSETGSSLLIGCTAGIMGGLYAAGGPPIAYYLYRQPLAIQTVRATLLAIIAFATLFRSGVAAWQGHITVHVLSLAALAIPVVLVMTMVGTKLLPVVPELMVRRVAFVLLILMGVSLVANGLI